MPLLLKKFLIVIHWFSLIILLPSYFIYSTYLVWHEIKIDPLLYTLIWFIILFLILSLRDGYLFSHVIDNPHNKPPRKFKNEKKPSKIKKASDGGEKP